MEEEEKTMKTTVEIKERRDAEEEWGKHKTKQRQRDQ